MTDDELYSEAETLALRGEHPLPAPCSSCGVEASYEDDVIPHIRHHEGCQVAATIRTDTRSR